MHDMTNAHMSSAHSFSSYKMPKYLHRVICAVSAVFAADALNKERQEKRENKIPFNGGQTATGTGRVGKPD
jgi:ribosomal protein S26